MKKQRFEGNYVHIFSSKSLNKKNSGTTTGHASFVICLPVDIPACTLRKTATMNQERDRRDAIEAMIF